ncbi:MAG: outer membrane lipoprotein carrier protein LolA [Devosia sp.]|uniref:LolA family protein n=1 Tax=Devosia sp. TaxID=1871048 RepID=UPI001ACC5B2B|nr:outer membrane lipoprotein carrier protein LolA [Devosia sp.]MBN9315970.1 outer membrane lipoprotein carrier protein LolA [Devosia sp.]
MIRRSFLAFAALLAAFPALAQQQGPAEPRPLTEAERQLITEINEHNSAIKTMVGRFLQIDTQGSRIEGTFFLERPGKILFRYNPPSSEQIVSVGRGFYVVDRKEQTQYAYPQDKVPLRQFLDSKIDLFKANIVAVAQSADYFSVTLQDDTPAGIVRVALVFDTESKDLKQWTLTQPSGAELTFSLYDVDKDVEIPKSYFYIDPNFRAVSAPKEE